MKTTGDVDPRQVIGAVFGADQLGNCVDHLGTGSIIGDGTVVLTAEHVVRDYPGTLRFAVLIDGQVQHFPLAVLESDWRSDLALLRIDGFCAPDPLHVLFDAHVSYNHDLLTLEYAQTDVTEAGVFVLNPALRRGHKTRNINADKLGPIAGVDALELSFPALKGASGAPIMFESTPFIRDEWKWGIVGVLVSNLAYHAIPAQIITVVGDDNSYIEERQYMLPQGLAVNIKHLRPMYGRVART